MLVGGILSRADFIVFFGSLLVVMAVGLWVGRRERTSQDFFLAGKDVPWWAVAGSIFGSNVSANHMVGMMAVGFSAGFVISHLEITAIAGLLLLCYFFLPIYRKLHIYTLSDYLGRRFDDRSRVAYSMIMLIIIVLVMMLPAFYMGSRAVNILMVDQLEIEQAQYTSRLENGAVRDSPKDLEPWQGEIHATKTRLDAINKELILVPDDKERLLKEQGELQEKWGQFAQVEISTSYYVWGIVIMALVTGVYTIVGGLRAVIITDVIQSVFILLGMLIVAWCTFNHELIGSWATMVEFDQNKMENLVKGKELLHLYKPSSDAAFPWTGMLSGLLVLHIYYWGANQFIVQRALAARSLSDARTGIIAAGFVKLLIPFVSIGTGIAAYYLFQQLMPGVKLDGDTAFPMLMREVVAPLAIPGLVGLVAAGLIGAILSSVDSMMNSAATLVTFDLYKRYINPKAGDKELVRMGRRIIAGLVVGSAALTIVIFDPNTKEPFMQYVITHQSRLVAGIVAAFIMGMLWRGATAAGGFAAIVTGIVVSYGLPPIYEATLAKNHEVVRHFGTQLNAFHSVFIAFVCSVLANVVVSRMGTPDESKSRMTWVGLNITRPADLQHFGMKLLGSLLVFALLATMMTGKLISPMAAAIVSSVWTFVMFLDSMFKVVLVAAVKGRAYSLLREDRFWAGLLASCAVFMMFYFY
jgi:SSS family solute:Na+ symporter